MGLISFLDLVEIKTKVASIIPFIFATLYSIYRFNEFNLKNFILMLISLLAFDMATTAINNYMDFKGARKTSGYNYETHNAIVRYKLKERTALIIILSLLFIATVTGILLVLNTNIVVLLLGIISFMVGILYSYGPIPISRMPLGELFSGVFMGFVITFISIYIHVYNHDLVSLVFSNGILNVSVNVIEIFYIFLISLPLVCGIGNIMLANNICDIEDDIENKRYTLPVFIGGDYALKLYKFVYYTAYLSIIFVILLKVEPLLSIITLLTFLKINKNIKLFNKEQSKKNTFVTSVQNFVLMNAAQIVFMVGAIVINKVTN